MISAHLVTNEHGKIVIVVTADKAIDLKARGSLRIRTDDPECAVLDVGLVAYPPGSAISPSG